MPAGTQRTIAAAATADRSASNAMMAEAEGSANPGEFGTWTIYSGSLMDILTIEKESQAAVDGEPAVSETSLAAGAMTTDQPGMLSLDQTMNSEIKQSLADIFSQANPILILTRSYQNHSACGIHSDSGCLSEYRS